METLKAVDMTHLSFNWPPDRPEFRLATVSDPGLAEAIGLSIALKYMDSQAPDFDATAPWRAATDQAISFKSKRSRETSDT